ncbi:MAG: glycosyl hydrolase 2 galactose-binding domain-containing protein [Kiritimatiellia bacterium]
MHKPRTLKQVTAPGRFGRAMNGLQGCVRIPGDAAYAKPPLTIEMWAKPFRGEGSLVRFPRLGFHYFYMLRFGTRGEFGVEMPGSNMGKFFAGQSVVDNRWHHLAAAFDGACVRLYVDGHETGSTPVTFNLPTPDRYPPLIIGTPTDPQTDLTFWYWQWAEPLTSWVEEIRISNIARKIDAVPAGPMPVDQHTIGLWRLGEARADGTVADRSKRKNAAQMTRIPAVSLDEMDREAFKAGPAAFDVPCHTVKLLPGTVKHAAGAAVVALDVQWEMAENGALLDRLDSAPWADAVPATVPGSVHGALQAAGRIPDPKVGRQDATARNKSFQTWWFRCKFPRPSGVTTPKLVFEGVAIRCTVWLNRVLLGSHEGMFGGPEFDIGASLQDDNTLVVKIDPAPFSQAKGAKDNGGWMKTVTFNNVYGWHYSDIPALGIWRSVRIEAKPALCLESVFVAARDTKGIVDVRADVRGLKDGWSGKLIGTVEPENFKGKSLNFTWPVKSATAAGVAHLRLQIPNPRLWWPNGLGEPNLYRLKLSLVADNGAAQDFKQTTFGIRTISMAPTTNGKGPTLYDWTFVINGEKRFIKGGGWCTMDSSMDFSRARYERFLTLAAQQHNQMVRAWGCGMPETDDFYDLCDRLGLLVMQEWPAAWDSHNTQPYDMMEETVRLNTLRIRNHPSLAMYGTGNELTAPFGRIIDMMGRYATELDGTRPFHRAEGYGGSQHDYCCWWWRWHLDYNLNMKAIFLGEFGIASLPVYESVQRYLPDAEKSVWPPPENGSLMYHTPVFNQKEDFERVKQYSGDFSAGATLQRFIAGSQLAQCVALRHPLELARIRWPDCTGALYYKLNDNYPAASWATSDWYGAPKMSHYFVQDAFAPLHACVLFESLKNNGKAVSLPVFLLDDNEALGKAAWRVTVRAFNGQLKLIKRQSFAGKGNIGRVKKLGEFALSAQETDTTPLLVVAEVEKAGKPVDRTFYFVNYEAVKDSLFNLPPTRLSLRVEGDTAVVTNAGDLPAVGVAVLRSGHLDTFTADDNYFWLDAGQSKTVRVSHTEGLMVEAWNSE